MKQGKQQMAVVLEVGKKRVFAIAQDWPGWCRSGSDEEAALQALFDYGPHYQRVLQASKIRFTVPKQLSNFVVVERIKGDATTDFGAPSRAWSEDTGPISPQELKRFQKILQACWVEFDKAVEDVRGKALRKGPRGVDGICKRSVNTYMTWMLLTSKAWEENQNKVKNSVSIIAWRKFAKKSLLHWVRQHEANYPHMDHVVGFAGRPVILFVVLPGMS